MVDFKKLLDVNDVETPTDPILIYASLDRASDKGPLRPAQEHVLKKWYSDFAEKKDVIVKLHTGQGKTLVGLLALQSRINSGNGPAVYLCPDKLLISQTCQQAKQFGIRTCTANDNLPEEFLNGTSILVASVQKLFNGRSKFGLNQNSIAVGSILLDDAHACSDRIRSAFTIRIERGDQAYTDLLSLFERELEKQGVGTFADIQNKKQDAILQVPYWSWVGAESDVANILSGASENKSIKFAWPLLRDMLSQCQCVFSGKAVEIEPYAPPLNVFRSYHLATHRIFMSATVTDDSFLIKGLNLDPMTVANPLTYSESWSGEKMVLIPSLIHDALDHKSMQEYFSRRQKFGVVALVPSFRLGTPWEKHGSFVADADTINRTLVKLRASRLGKTVVLVNRYDGVDLPDDSCRVLVFDGVPFSESLTDRHSELVRPESESTLMRTLRSVEQGMGRSVRGEKDFSVIVLIGNDLVRLLRDTRSRRFLSTQISRQIEIGLEISHLAREDAEDAEESDGEEEMSSVIRNLVGQCLERDEGWKQFYTTKMGDLTPAAADLKLLNIFRCELEAEQAFSAGRPSEAAEILQGLMDNDDLVDKSWYLQESARYLYQSNRQRAEEIQNVAYRKNRLLLKPASGVQVEKLKPVSERRTEQIMAWMIEFASYSDLQVVISDILSKLRYPSNANKFESALNELGTAIGFAAERPDKMWKEGPDNLWVLDSETYLLMEAKSEVKADRSEINKREAEQMNRSTAWFEKIYGDKSVTNLFFHPAKRLASSAALLADVKVVTGADLNRLVKACEGFFGSFQDVDFRDLSLTQIQQRLDQYKLGIPDLRNVYSRVIRERRQPIS